jgi:predicted murein hydrolase (TIGR00659 family)
MLTELLKQPVLQVTITLVLYALANRLYQRIHFFLFNPLILAAALVVGIFWLAGIDYATYNKGAQIITFFLGPATVALGVPLYKQLPVIRKNYKAIVLGVFIGSVTAVVSTVLIAKAMGASKYTLYSLAAKSTTMPIALGITEKLGGNDKLIVFAVAVTGIFGGMVGPEILKFFRVKSRIATGLGIGTAAHAGGTSRAVRLGEIEGSMSSAAIVLTGLVTALLAPLLVRWLI